MGVRVGGGGVYMQVNFRLSKATDPRNPDFLEKMSCLGGTQTRNIATTYIHVLC